MAKTPPFYPEWIDPELTAISLVCGVFGGIIAGSLYPPELQPYGILATMIVGPFLAYPFMHFMTGRDWERPEEHNAE